MDGESSHPCAIHQNTCTGVVPEEKFNSGGLNLEKCLLSFIAGEYPERLDGMPVHSLLEPKKKKKSAYTRIEAAPLSTAMKSKSTLLPCGT